MREEGGYRGACTRGCGYCAWRTGSKLGCHAVREAGVKGRAAERRVLLLRARGRQGVPLIPY